MRTNSDGSDFEVGDRRTGELRKGGRCWVRGFPPVRAQRRLRCLPFYHFTPVPQTIAYLLGGLVQREQEMLLVEPCRRFHRNGDPSLYSPVNRAFTN